MRRLPPLSSLRAFEAAARHGSFKQAAAELAVTPTAISHQIRSLEDHSGLTLFDRRTRQVVLTAAGAELYPVLRDGFDAFVDVLTRLTKPAERAQVRISATIAFTAKWLVPRVANFQLLHPEVDLQLHASDEPVDLRSGGTDLAIRYGTGHYPGLEAQLLFADEFAPVANPMLGVSSPQDLVCVPLIEFEWRRRHPHNPTWACWFTAAGLADSPGQARLRFSDESHAIQAAVAAQGVALVSLPLVHDDLSAGRLVRLFGPTLPGYAHHLLKRPDSASTPVDAAANWLLSEAHKVVSCSR